MPCIPCLEAMLLSLFGDVQQAQSTDFHKKAFEKRFGKPAHATSLYALHFSKELLDKARFKSPELESILQLITAANKVNP